MRFGISMQVLIKQSNLNQYPRKKMKIYDSSNTKGNQNRSDRNQEKKWTTKNSNSNSNNNNNSDQSRGSKPALPGYYFDAATNRYYKIDKTHKPPQTPAPAPTKLTREDVSLMRKQASPERTKIVIHMKQNKRTTKKFPLASSTPNSTLTEVVPSFITRREIGIGSLSTFKRNIQDIVLQREYRNVAQPNALSVVNAVSGVFQADIQLSAKRQKVIYVFNDGNMVIKSIQARNQLHLANDANYQLGFKLDVATRVDAEITSVRWCPNMVPLISITTFGAGGIDGCLQFFAESSLGMVRSMAVKKSSLWTHEWSRDGTKLLLGASSKGLLLDTTSNKFSRLWTAKSDVFAVQFDTTEKLAFVGSRDGKIRTHDLRTDTTQKPAVFPMNHNMPITCLKVLKDDNYLLAESMDGVIQTWDRRMQTPVQVFHGLRNEATLLRFQVDDKESILAAGDHCGFINIWNLRSGKFLNSFGTFAPPVRNVACLDYAASSLEDRDASCIVLSDRRLGLEAWTPSSD